jgi:glycogen synthase
LQPRVTRPRSLMIAMSAIAMDSRLQREIGTLDAAGVDVSLVCLAGPPWAGAPAGLRVLPLERRSRPGAVGRVPNGWRRHTARGLRWLLLPEHRRRIERRFREAARRVAATQDYEVVHSHDLPTLQVGADLAVDASVPLVYDAHECWTGRARFGRPTPLGDRKDRRREAATGRAALRVLTVSEGLKNWFERRYAWDHVEVVRNSFPAEPSDPPPSEPSAVLYAGRLAGGRDLATVVAGADLLDGLATVLVGPRDPSFHLKVGERVQLLDPVDVSEVSRRYHSAGLAVISLADSCLNHRLALPNKLFQAVQAGVPVVAADLPELRRIVQRWGLGTLYRPGSVDSYTAAVHQALGRYQEFRANVQAAAPALSWERDAARLVEVYREIGVVP